jgi:hypothetical protein
MANGKCRSKEQDARDRDYRRLPAGSLSHTGLGRIR